MRKKSDWSRISKFDLILAVLILLPAFPAIPLFILGIYLGKRLSKVMDGSERYVIQRVILALLMIGGICIWAVFRADLGHPREIMRTCIVLFFLGGLPTGLLFQTLRHDRWIATLPLAFISVIGYYLFYGLQGMM